MRKAVLSVGVLLTTGLAGCIGAGDEITSTGTELPEAPDALDLGVPTFLSYTACTEQFGMFPFPMDEAAAMMPEGFEPEAFPMGPPGFAALYVIGFTCQGTAGEGLDVQGAVEFEGILGVIPPEEYRKDEFLGYGIYLGSFVSDEALVEVYQAWGIKDIIAGPVEFVVQDTPIARAGHVLGTDGAFTVHLYTAVEGQPTMGEAGKFRAFVVGSEEEDEEEPGEEAEEEDADEAKEVTGTVDVEWTAANTLGDGQAVLRFEEGMPMPFPPPAMPGYGMHAWGDEYAYTAQYTRLDDDEDENDEDDDEDPDASAAGLVARLFSR